MKRSVLIIGIIISSLFLSSFSFSNEDFSLSIQKRKYRKGFYISFNSSMHKSVNKKHITETVQVAEKEEILSLPINQSENKNISNSDTIIKQTTVSKTVENESAVNTKPVQLTLNSREKHERTHFKSKKDRTQNISTSNKMIMKTEKNDSIVCTESIKDKDTKSKLATLWTAFLLNYAYGDIFTLMNPSDLKAIFSGTAGNIAITQGFLLNAAIYIELPIVMLILSKFLSRKANRWANIILAGLYIPTIIGSFFVGTAVTPFYAFLSVCEIAILSVILWKAIKWKAPKNS